MGYFAPIFLFCIAAVVNGMHDGQRSYEDPEFIRELVGECSKKTVEDFLCETKSSNDLTFPNIAKDINFFVYKRHDVDKPYQLNFNSAVNPECVKKERRTYIFIHGWISRDIFLDSLKNGYWARDDNDINVIEVDWSKISNNLVYFPCVKRVPSVGETVAKFIEFNRERIDLDKLTIVGHSLGAHVAGYAGKFLQKNHKLMVPRIIGLDPAGFRFRGHNKKLQPGDAREVIVIHTTKILGHFEPLGTLDIYLNGGKKQPDFGHIQSHRFAKKFFESLFRKIEPIAGYRYSSFDEVKDGKIPKTGEIKLFGGEPVPPKGTLVYVSTKNQLNLISKDEVVDSSDSASCGGCRAFRLRSKRSSSKKPSSP